MKRPGNSGFEQRLGLIVEGARKIDLLLDGLVAYSVALQTNPASFQSAPMGVLLRSVLAKLNQDLRDCGAEVAYDDLPAVTGNPDRLMQVLENLLRNALVHRGHAAPHIDITAVRQAEEWLFAVRDNGPGVDAASLEKIFLPFERLRAVSVPASDWGWRSAARSWSGTADEYGRNRSPDAAPRSASPCRRSSSYSKLLSRRNSGANLVGLIRPQLIVQGPQAETQQLGGALLVVLRVLQRQSDVGLFHFAHRDADRNL